MCGPQQVPRLPATRRSVVAGLTAYAVVHVQSIHDFSNDSPLFNRNFARYRSSAGEKTGLMPRDRTRLWILNDLRVNFLNCYLSLPSSSPPISLSLLLLSALRKKMPDICKCNHTQGNNCYKLWPKEFSLIKFLSYKEKMS